MLKLLTFPNKIISAHKLYLYMECLKIPYTNDPTDMDITHVHYYDYANRITELPGELRMFESQGKYIINGQLRNIKKDYIDKVFSDIFGYSIQINPVEHRGSCISKSTQNATHGGKIIRCPIKDYLLDTRTLYSGSGEPHTRMYQKLIDTRIANDRICDYRLVVMGYKPVILFEKHMHVTSTFHPDPDKFFQAFAFYELDNHFSADEIEKINKFLFVAGVDCAEVDILRDNSTGLMYIVDVNSVPGGTLFNHLSNGQQYIEFLADQYKSIYLS